MTREDNVGNGSFVEFDCIEGGRHIYRPSTKTNEDLRCSACSLVPFWYNSPDLANAIDPNNERKVRNPGMDIPDALPVLHRPSPKGGNGGPDEGSA